MKKSSGKVVRYNKWGYIFLIPFIVVYVIFQLIPLISTIYNSFFENYMSGLTQVGPCKNCKRRADSRLTQGKGEGCCELCGRKLCTLEKEVRLL